MADIPADGDARNIYDELRPEHVWNFAKPGRSCCGALFAVVALCVVLPIPARAHNGPPFPLFENRRVGPYVIALWTHPDLGYGTFFVIVDPAPGAKIPSDLKMEVAVQPETGRLSERTYEMWRDPVRDHVQFDQNRVEFDQQEFWRVRLVMKSSAGNQEILSRVEPTPTGLGRWDLVLYALPFAFAGFMWYRGMSRRKKMIRRKAAGMPGQLPKAAVLQGAAGNRTKGGSEAAAL
ncbi:MAG TPA: hypothetical protein VJ731_13830 [Terriglobales bacterium]|nr:hypothetical protein [Terriglobales bacterium]